MISLTAEQKTIEGIFGSPNETYVIPMYQRPYSWGFDQLYDRTFLEKLRHSH